jgi:hypothetical protein
LKYALATPRIPLPFFVIRGAKVTAFVPSLAGFPLCSNSKANKYSWLQPSHLILAKLFEKIAAIRKPFHKPFDIRAKETVYSFKTVMPRQGA